MNNDFVVSIDKKLDATKEELRKIQESLDPSSLEYAFSRSSLESRLADLQAEREQLQISLNKERLKLIMKGEEVGRGRISARILSGVLGGFQLVTDSIANALGHEPTAKGRIPMDILRQSDMMVSGAFPGSFGLELEARVEQDDLLEEPLLSQTLSKLFDLISSGTDEDILLEHVAELGPRTLTHYKQWVKSMSEYGVSVTCDWSTRYTERYRWTMDLNSFPALIDTLESIQEEDTEEVALNGTLMGINLRRETFEFVEHSTGHVISGRSKHEVLRKSRGILGEGTNAQFIKSVARNKSTGKEKATWFLVDITR